MELLKGGELSDPLMYTHLRLERQPGLQWHLCPLGNLSYKWAICPPERWCWAVCSYRTQRVVLGWRLTGAEPICSLAHTVLGWPLPGWVFPAPEWRCG